jgi:hypothetical protein
VKDGSYAEGNKKAVTVMVKDAKKYATTGGGGVQVWAGGDPSKPLVPDSAHAVPLASPATARKKPKIIRFQRTFPEIGSHVQFLWHSGGWL